MSDYVAQNPSSLHLDPNLMSRVAAANEAVWFRIGVLQSLMNDRDRALEAFERVLAVNPGNVRAMTQAGAALAKKEMYPQAVSYLQRAISAESTCGEAWAVLAHCYVMTDDLQKAYQAYQSALSHLPNPKDPNLWYGIGLLYDRYGSLDHALEAFLLVLSISPEFERADEVCFCIGIIYKEQQNFDDALKYFNKVVVAANPPPPLTRADGWYQIGHVSELKRDISAALEMYKQALTENPKHPKTLQNLGWLEHQHNQKSTEAIRLLKMSSELDSTDGQTWYLLGRVYMALREFRQAYDAYQQAVYRDGRNATFWCSIGVLYYQMNQYRDAMDAYSRAIVLNPHVSEVWYDLGTLYESCGQNVDAIDAYRRAAKLAPENNQITARLSVLENNANPSAMAQQQELQQQQQQHSQQPQLLQQSGSQPMQSISAPISQPQPQMHPDKEAGQHGGDGMNSSIGRQPMQSMQGIRRPAGQSPPSHLHPPPQLNPPISRPGMGLTAPSTYGPIEVAPIHPLPSAAGLSDSHAGVNNSSYPHHDQTPPQTGPMTSGPLQSNGASVNPLTSMGSQPMSSQGPTAMLPPISSSAIEPIKPLPSRSSPANNHMQSSSHQPMRQGDVMQQHVIMPSKDSQQNSHHQSVPGPRMPSPKPSQPMHSPQKQSMHSDQQDGHSQNQQGGYDQVVGSHNQSQQQQGQQQPVTSPGQRSHHSQHPSQPPTSMAQIPSLSSLPNLPPVQQQQSNEDADKSDRHRSGMGRAVEDRDRSNPAMDTGNTASQYGQGENNRRSEHESREQRDDNRLARMTRGEEEVSLSRMTRGETEVRNRNDGSIGGQEVDSNRSGYSAPMQSNSMGVPRDRIPSIRESVVEGGSSGPNSSRQMTIHDVTRQDGLEDSRRHSSQRHEDSQRDRDERDSGQNGRESPQQNGASDRRSDRLPGMNSLPTPMDMGSNRDSRDEGEMQSSMPQGSPPSLSLPSAGPLRSISVNEVGKPSGSPSHGASSPGTGSGMGTAGASLPPLSSGRNSSSLPRLNQDAKDMASSGGISTGLIGSSLTKFGRTPPTPVTNSVVPSSLPSPLSTRKTGNSSSMVHSGRSPRLSKSTSGGGFKPIQMSAPNSNYGPVERSMEQVPSPGSLPVLPPMSRPGEYSDGEKMAGKEKRVEDSERESERRGDHRNDHRGDHRGDQHRGEQHRGEQQQQQQHRGDQQQHRGDLRSEHRGENRMKYGGGDEKSDEDVGENNSVHGRGVSDDVLENKPVFGVLRSGISSGEKEMDRDDEKMKSVVSSPNRGGVGVGNVVDSGTKRESMGSKEDMGRTPKRPRLHDVNDKDMTSKSYGTYNDGGGNEEGDKGGNKEMPQRKEEDMVKGGSSGGLSKSDMSGSFKDMKVERRSGSGSQDDVKKIHRRESGGSSGGGSGGGGGGGGRSGNDTDISKNGLIELPRLSNQAMSKLSGPPLSGNQPLPSFRSERGKSLASRGGTCGGGGGSASSVGKALTSDNSSRGSLPFPLRSAPAPVVSGSIPTLKSLNGVGGSGAGGGVGGVGGGSSGRGGGSERGGERGDYENSPRMGENSSSKRVGEEKNDGSLTRSGGRGRD